MKQTDWAFDKLHSLYNVSHETFRKMEIYHQLLIKWQQKINLVSPKTLDNAWERHFLDSAQLFPLLSYPEHPIFDLGSGAGFPGLILSIMGTTQINLIESDQRKCVFLSEVIRLTQTSAKVFNLRIESVEKDFQARVVTSRACASLDNLLNYAYPLLSPEGECLFLKGRGVESEISEAQKRWMFHVEQHPSITEAEGCILRIRGLEPV